MNCTYMCILSFYFGVRKMTILFNWFWNHIFLFWIVMLCIHINFAFPGTTCPTPRRTGTSSGWIPYSSSSSCRRRAHTSEAAPSRGSTSPSLTTCPSSSASTRRWWRPLRPRACPRVDASANERTLLNTIHPLFNISQLDWTFILGTFCISSSNRASNH